MLLQFEGLTANSRYEVIVQSKNRFGWSEPAKSFLFTTRLKGKVSSNDGAMSIKIDKQDPGMSRQIS